MWRERRQTVRTLPCILVFVFVLFSIRLVAEVFKVSVPGSAQCLITCVESIKMSVSYTSGYRVTCLPHCCEIFVAAELVQLYDTYQMSVNANINRNLSTLSVHIITPTQHLIIFILLYFCNAYVPVLCIIYASLIKVSNKLNSSVPPLRID